MKKRGLFYAISVIFLLILIPNVSSIYEERVYSETVEDKDIVEIAGSLFEFRIDSTSNKVYVEIDISAVIVTSGECQIKDNFDICIKDISFSYRNLTEYYDVYKAQVSVYLIKSKIDIKNTIGKTNILIDEDTTAELIIENTADIVAEDVTATIDIPTSILITDLEGCKKTFDSIIFQADVHPRQIKKCTYKIKGLAADDFDLKADVTYFDGINQINTTSSTNVGKVYNYSLKISLQTNKTKFNILENFNLEIVVENIND